MMLQYPTLNRLNAMELASMARAFDELAANAEAERLTHSEWLALLLDREWSFSHDRKLAARLRFAKLRHQATSEDVDYRSHRGLDRGLFLKLVAGDWIAAPDNLVICGPTGIGKSWLACALGHKACRDDVWCCISVRPSCSPAWHWLAATAATPASWRSSAAMTGGLSHSTLMPATTSSKS
jgi:DNA replication protein DnaC